MPTVHRLFVFMNRAFLHSHVYANCENEGRPLRCDGSQTFFEWCLTVTPGACPKTAPTLLPLGFFGAVFFGFLGSRPDRFCPFAIVASNHDCSKTMMRHSQIKWLVFRRI